MSVLFDLRKGGTHILRYRLLSLTLIISLIVCITAEPVSAAIQGETKAEREERYRLTWEYSTDAERYYLPTEIKAYACGLSKNDFILFAKVVEGEGDDNDDNITDKVLVACTVLNRVNCRSWPTTNVKTTLQRPGQFTVVDKETGECKLARSLDSEWAIVIAYRMVEAGEVDCHMVYYNAIGFTGYSRAFTDYAYCGGNYFSVIPCDCESCTAREPDWKEEDVEMVDFEILRPEGVGPNYI